MDDDYDDDPHGPACPLCGAEMWRERCWYCHGEGGWHDCGEDCCCCLHPDTNIACPECGGEGGYWECYEVRRHRLRDKKERVFDA